MKELEGLLLRARRQTLGDVLARTAARMPEKEALAFEGKRVTYMELDHFESNSPSIFAGRLGEGRFGDSHVKKQFGFCDR